jgi:hypothetical protein
MKIATLLTEAKMLFPDFHEIKLDPDRSDLHEQWIDTSSKAVRRAHRDWWIQKQTELNDTFTKSNVDAVSVRTDQDYVKALLNLFAKRN